MWGLLLTFFVSGVVHEIIMCQLQDEARGPWRWKWLLFFTVQAPLVIVELQLKRWWLQKKHLPPLNIWIARALTTMVMMCIATPLFFTPADVETDTGARMLAALKHGYAGLVAPFQGALASCLDPSWRQEL